MLKVLKNRLPLYLAGLFLVFWAVFAVSCSNWVLGMGDPVDLEAPEIFLDRVELPGDNGDVEIIESANITIVIGFHGAILHGRARDNVLVKQIIMTGDGKEWIAIPKIKSAGGWQEWSIRLDDEEDASTYLTNGEVVLDISAEDSSVPPNIGPNSARQVTLLVDTAPPVFKDVKVERQPGLQVDLLDSPTLRRLVEEDEFQSIDYFQNERFAIRATISHDYSLDSITLNFIDLDDANKTPLFPAGLAPNPGSSLYTPVWEITAAMLENINAKYKTGPRYIGVTMTAKAEAGHSGDYPDEMINYLRSFCWWPESDHPRIVVAKAKDDVIDIGKGEMIPVRTFDDDNLNTMRIAILTKAQWTNLAGLTDEDKIQSPEIQWKEWLGGRAANIGIRNAVVSGDVNNERGEYRMAVISRDGKDYTGAEVERRKVYIVNVREDGIPVISITSHRENQIPNLRPSGINFTLEGNITNLDKVSVFRMAWISATLDSTEQDRLGREILSDPTKTDAKVTVWEPKLKLEAPTEIGTKTYQRQSFTQTFDISGSFKVNGATETQQPMFFMFYTESGENKVFQTLRLMPHTNPPVIDIVNHDPTNMDVFSQGDDIHFIITVTSPDGLLINDDGVQMHSSDRDDPVTLTKTGYWEGRRSHDAMGSYLYIITAVDALGNSSQLELYVVVSSLPVLERVTSPHNAGTIFSGQDTITINAEFNRAVATLNTHDGKAIPKIELEGFINPDGSPDTKKRYAVFVDKRGTDIMGHSETKLSSTVISFTYEVQPNDRTGPDGLKATRITMEGDVLGEDGKPQFTHISAEGFYEKPDYPLTDPSITLPATRFLEVDGVAPRVVNMTFHGTEGSGRDAEGKRWYRAGEELEIKVTTDKRVMVLGTVELKLSGLVSIDPNVEEGVGTFNPNHYARFQKMDGDYTMVFSYKIYDQDKAEPLILNPKLCFEEVDMALITDKGIGVIGGNNLEVDYKDFNNDPAPNPLGLVPIYIDAVPPPSLFISVTGTTAPPATPTHTMSFRITGEMENLDSVAPIERYSPNNTQSFVQYSVNNGLNWLPGTDDVPVSLGSPYEFTIVSGTGLNTYNVIARQTDRAGNVSEPVDPYTFTMGSQSELLSIVCENGNGAYPTGSNIRFKITFSGRVMYNSTNNPLFGSASITIYGGGANNTGDTVVPISVTTGSEFALNAVYTVPEGITMNPVQISAINLTGVRKQDTTPFDMDDTPLQTRIASAIAAFNGTPGVFTRPNLKVMSVRPRITAIGQAGQTLVAPGTSFIVTPTANNSEISLRFSHEVWAQRGRIKVKPYGDWRIPPVLSSSEYTAVESALSGVTIPGTNPPQGYYKATTHGLRIATAADIRATGDIGYSGVPGTDTYYVPDTSTKYVLDFNTGIEDGTAVANLRNAFNAANYMVQDYEVVASQVTGASGTTDVRIRLDRLADGRQWVIEIDEGAFRDEAGNNSVGSNTNWFWSQTTAVPVIRVNRISNNRATSNSSGTYAENVQYRIDCETPDASIVYGTSLMPTPSVSIVATINTSMTQTSTFSPSTFDGPQNSMSRDITTGTLQGMAANTSYTGTTTIGDTSLYTARKDYIAARATHGILSASGRGYEGAFKTVIVFRDVGIPENNGWQYIKFEGSNTQNGPVTIDGFPLSNNKMDGSESKFAYRNPNTQDHIWVTWEIVANFWHVGMVINDNSPTAALATNGWDYFGDYQNHSFRKYGNWGMRVGRHN